MAKAGVPRAPKELDVNGQPVKKARPKRATKLVEEVSIFFRVKTQAEKIAEDAPIDAGFPPSAPASDNEGDEADG